MGSFVFTQYTGEDAGRVLVALLSGDDLPVGPEGAEEHDVKSNTQRIIGFQLEVAEPDEEEEEEDDD